MNRTNQILTVTILLLIIIFIFCNKKQHPYKKTQSIEYNTKYNEKHPIIDTIQPYYKNANLIFVRAGYKINGHDKIGVCTGGSQLWFECSDTCKKCLYLHSGRKP